MQSGMMDVPLLTTSILRFAATYHGEQTIASRTVEGDIRHVTYAAFAERCAKLAGALVRLGLQPGDRVATLAWNTSRHLELYYAVPGCGLICHPINPRLFRQQIRFILEDAGDTIIFADVSFMDILRDIAPSLSALRSIVVLTYPAHMPDGAGLPPLSCYEDFIADEPAIFPWPLLNETTASGLCYTSGTTGHPKGVVYSHRSTVLHAMTACMPDLFDMAATTVLMPIVPMFHVNAWGFPYAAPMVGCKLVLPGPRLDGASLGELIRAEGVGVAAGVPTVFMGLLDWAEAHGGLEPLRRVIIGGAACTQAMIARFKALGVDVQLAWGMTEMSPLGLANTPKPRRADHTDEELASRPLKQGRPMFGVEMSVVDAAGTEIARDGHSFGALHVRGPWVASSYLGVDTSPAHQRAGWFDTGDIVTMDRDGFVQIVDRSKDLIKSGGEWISSLDIENIAADHPAVREAAVIARSDERWGERPRLIVVLRPDAHVDEAALLAHFTGRIANWCIPDDVVFVDELPHTATGKLLKTELRDRYGGAPHGALGGAGI